MAELHERLRALADLVDDGGFGALSDEVRAIFEAGVDSLDELVEENRFRPAPKYSTLREDSGNVDSADPFTTFLYMLMRNEMPAGTVARAFHETIGPIYLSDDRRMVSKFSNGWLARYADYIVRKLREVTPNPPPVMTRDADMRPGEEEVFFEKME